LPALSARRQWLQTGTVLLLQSDTSSMPLYK